MARHVHPPLSPVLAGLRGCCPRCSRGRLFDGYLRLGQRCDACGLDYAFADAGDGPAVFIILVVGFIVVGGALIVEALYQPPYWLHAVIWLPLAVLLCLGALRPFKAVLIALQYKHKAQEGRLSTD